MPQPDARAEYVFTRCFVVGLLIINITFAVKKQVTISHSALEACKSKEAIVIATEWKEFKEIDWQTVYDNMNKPAFVFDGRLLVDADKLRQIGFKVSFFIDIFMVHVSYASQVKVIGRGSQ